MMTDKAKAVAEFLMNEANYTIREAMAVCVDLGGEIEREEIEGYDLTVYTEEEAETAWDEYLENYIEDCILYELPEQYRGYFDREGWKSDAKYDGRGHSLSGYDGVEYESFNGFYIYRN